MNRKPKSKLNDCYRNVVTQMVLKRLCEVAPIQGRGKKSRLKRVAVIERWSALIIEDGSH